MSPLNAYRRWRAKCRIKRSVSRMSELGREIAQALREDEWAGSEYTVTHGRSGLQLWVANGKGCFRIYGIKGLHYKEDQFKAMLNEDDVDVLWPLVCSTVNRLKEQPAVAVLNMLRLSQHAPEKLK